MFRHKVTMVLAASLAGALGTFGIAVASGVAADSQGGSQGSVIVVGGAAAGNGDSFDGGVDAGPTSDAVADAGDGGYGGDGGRGADGKDHRGHGGEESADARGGWGGGAGGAGASGGAGGPAGALSDDGGGGKAASQSSVNNSGNSANTNVASVDVQVNPDIRARNESTNVVISSNDNDNDNNNDNSNDAGADADAGAVNANVNANLGVNAIENTNSNTNTNGPQSAGQRTCESYGGTFTAVGSGGVLWTCTNLANLGDTPAFDTRAEDLATSCTADGGFLFEQSLNPPQDALCA